MVEDRVVHVEEDGFGQKGGFLRLVRHSLPSPQFPGEIAPTKAGRLAGRPRSVSCLLEGPWIFGSSPQGP